MADISSSKSSFLCLRMYVMIFVGASLLCERISALEILTEKTVSLWLNKTNQSIPCDVRLADGERIAGFSWSKLDKESNPVIIVKLFRDAVTGPGIDSGNVSLSEEKSLVLHRSLTIEDEGKYICRVVLSGAPTGYHNSSTIRVLSAPKELYPTIRECENDNEHVESDDSTCLIKRETGMSLNLTCEVSGFRPLVDLRWTNATRDDFASAVTLTNNSDGTQSVSVTFEITASFVRQEFACNMSGEAVSGHKWSVVAVQGVEASGSPMVVIIVIIVAILLVVLVLLIVIVFILKSRKRSKSHSVQKTNQDKLTELEKGSDVHQIQNNHYTKQTVSVVVEEPMVETKLNEGTQTDIPEAREEDDRLSTVTSDREQSEGLLTNDEREDSQSNSRGPSLLSSRSDIAHHDFGESWVCVSPEELKNLQERKDDDRSEGAEAGSSGERPQRPGAFRSMIQGIGSFLDTFNNFIRHEA